MNKLISLVISYLIRNFSGFTKYRLHEQTFGSALKEWQPDLIHAHDLLTLPTAIKTAKKIGAKVVYDAHELETHRNPPLPFLERKFVERTERKNIRKADAVITVCDPIADHLRDEFNINRPAVVMNAPQMRPTPEGTSQRILKDTWVKSATRDHWRVRESSGWNLRVDAKVPPEKKIAVYVGLVTVNRGLETVIQALRYLPEVCLVAVGPQNEKQADALRAMAKRLGVQSQFRIRPPVAPNRVVEYVRSADFGVCPVWPVTLSYEWALPNKVFEMAFAGIPIVSSDIQETARFILKNRLGSIYSYDDPYDCAQKITQLIETDFRISPEHMQSLIDEYCWEEQANSIKSIYEELLNEKKERTGA